MMQLKHSYILKRVSIFILFFIFLSPLFSSTFRVLVVGSGIYGDMVKSALETTGSVVNDEALSIAKKREMKKVEMLYLKERSKMLENEEFEKLKTLTPPIVEDYDSAEIEVVDITFPPSLYKYLKEENEEIFNFLGLYYDVDRIYYVETEEEGEFFYAHLYENGTLIREAWVSNEIKKDEEEALTKMFISSLLDDDYSLYKLSLYPEDASFSLDGKEIFSTSLNSVVLKNGEHEYSLSSYGYDEIEGKINVDGRDGEIVLSLSPSRENPLYISMRPWKGKVFINGEESDKKNIKILSPYILTLSEDGYKTKTFQSANSQSTVFLSLEPEWMGKKDSIKEGKDNFYRDIFISLLSFGGYVALSAIDNISSPPFVGGLKFVFAGGAICSLISLLNSTFEYYDAVTRGVM